MNAADKARAAAVHFEAKKDALSQLQSGNWKLTFTVQPGDVPMELLKASMGTRYMVALVEIGDDEQPVEKPKDNPHRLSQQCALTCQEMRFWRFLDEKHNHQMVYSEDDAANCLRIMLGIHSRSELDHNPDAAARWRNLKSEFEAWLIT